MMDLTPYGFVVARTPAVEPTTDKTKIEKTIDAEMKKIFPNLNRNRQAHVEIAEDEDEAFVYASGQITDTSVAVVAVLLGLEETGQCSPDTTVALLVRLLSDDWDDDSYDPWLYASVSVKLPRIAGADGKIASTVKQLREKTEALVNKTETLLHSINSLRSLI